MIVFVSSQSVDAANARTLIQHLMASGLAVDHSPRNPLDGDDPRWHDWFKKGLPAAVAAADCFVIVIDGGWDSSTWMGEEAHIASVSGLPMYYWNPAGIQVKAKGMLPYLKRKLSDDLADAVQCLAEDAQTEQTHAPEPAAGPDTSGNASPPAR
jgi:hypothetical protein